MLVFKHIFRTLKYVFLSKIPTIFKYYILTYIQVNQSLMPLELVCFTERIRSMENTQPQRIVITAIVMYVDCGPLAQLVPVKDISVSLRRVSKIFY